MTVLQLTAPLNSWHECAEAAVPSRFTIAGAGQCGLLLLIALSLLELCCGLPCLCMCNGDAAAHCVAGAAPCAWDAVCNV